MKDSHNATLEFINQHATDDAPGDPGATADADRLERSRAAAFEFVKQLAAELSAGTFELPPFPEVAMRVRDALDDPDANADRIGRIVLSEPVLSARLLRMANSALLRRGPLEVTDVKLAIARLGFDVVRNATASLAMESAFAAPAGGALRRHIEDTRRHSVQVAVLCYVLAKRSAGGPKPDEAMLAGLLHDIGRFYILTRVNAFPDLFEHPESLEALLRDWHTGVGRAIVESWGFPEAIAVAVDEHELLERAHPGKADVTDVALVANLLAHRGDPSRPEQPLLGDIPACRALKLDEPTCLAVIENSEEEIRSMAQALGGGE